jgi:ParB family chromosome partitioning protein
MTSKKRGLGRGLEALLVDVPAKDDRENAADISASMQEVERLKAQLSATVGKQELEQRREQLPTTAGKQELEQRREQLPRAKQTPAAAEKQQAPATADEIDSQAVIAAALIKNIQRENSHLLEEAESLISLLDEFELMVRRFEID